MRDNAMFFRAVLMGSALGLLCFSGAGAQTTGKAQSKESTPVLTKERLFEGAELSAENQSKVLGNLLKYMQTPKTKGEGYFDMKVPATPEPPTSLPAMQITPSSDWLKYRKPDPCTSVADDAQLGAMHRLLVTTLSSRSLNLTDFAAKVPQGCNGQRLRYYLNVTAQLFPEGDKK